MQIELQYIVKNIKFCVEFKTSVFDDETEMEIKSFVDQISNEICIDKSFVKCDTNKYTDVFLTEEGWESLKHMLLLSVYGTYLGKKDQEMLTNVFASIAECYILSSMMSYFDFEYINIADHVELTLDKKSVFDVIVIKDTATEWKDNTIKE